MYYLIQDGYIVGSSDIEPVGLPQGMTLVNSELTLDPSRLYYDGSEVRVIPDKPSSNAVWSGNSWVIPEPRVTSVMSQDLLSDPVSLAAKQKIAEDTTPFIAEVLGYILARLVGNQELEGQQYDTLKTMLGLS